MTDDDKALVERLKRFSTRPIEHDAPAMNRFAMKEAADRIEALQADNARLREALDRANEAHWFYYGDDCSSDNCRMDVHECIDEDFEWDNKPEGDHVLLISGARPVPNMWIALHYFTEEEKDARQDDETYTYTVHATQAEAEEMIEVARAALQEQSK